MSAVSFVLGISFTTSGVGIGSDQVGLGQISGHTPVQRVAASTLRRYSFSLRLAIAQADARPAMPASLR